MSQGKTSAFGLFRLRHRVLCATLSFLTICSLRAQTLQQLYSFQGGSDGGGPFAGLAEDRDGNLYGTTNYGGSSACHTDFEQGCGTIFRVTQSGEHTILHRFTSGVDEKNPYATLLLDSAGNIYGTAAGGFVDGGPPFGSAFAITNSGKPIGEYRFKGGSDGTFATGGLVRDQAGNFYGTTNEGGLFGFGTVYKVDAHGKETIVYGFGNPPDAADPLYEILAFDSQGNLYGTTFDGGTFGEGTVFVVNIESGQEKVLYSFMNQDDGGLPASGVILDAQGNIYGTTSQGGAEMAGTIFKLTPEGKETVIYAFKNGADGVFPMGTLAHDSQGNFYGATLFGGVNDFGTVFEVTSAGEETLLHTFGGNDGMYPWGGVIRDDAGNLYGTTSEGGTFNFGTVYKLTP